jgi:hypothetical protein
VLCARDCMTCKQYSREQWPLSARALPIVLVGYLDFNMRFEIFQQDSNIIWLFIYLIVYLLILVGLGFEVRASCLLYPVSHTCNPFCSGCFGDGVSWIICIGWPWTMILLILASQVARCETSAPTGLYFYKDHISFVLCMIYYYGYMSRSNSKLIFTTITLLERWLGSDYDTYWFIEGPKICSDRIFSLWTHWQMTAKTR